MSVYKFGAFELDQAERVLLREGKKLSLTPKVFDTLLVLVQSAGRLMTKESLLEEIWPDAFVEEANLSVNVASLRRALGETPGEHQYIETVSKRGYRFVANVVLVERERDSVVERSELRSTAKAAEESPGGTDSGFKSLAVLPFGNASADPNADYLSDGLTESIINRMSQLHNLQVVARTTVFRYKDEPADPKAVGRELGVRSVLSGRILQLGDRLIIRAELIDVLNGCQIWGEQYHRSISDILAVQEEISEAISERLKVQLTLKERERLSKHYTENGEAYKNYLKGRYHWNKFDQSSLKRAIDYFSQAIDADPTYALAYAGLADSYYRLSNVYAPTRDAMPKAKAAAIKALEIDDELSEAHAALGLIRMLYEWDWSGAQEELRRAVEITPNNAVAHQRFALFLMLLGRFHEAKQHLEIVLTVDPLSAHAYWHTALSLFLQHKHELAIEEIRKALDLDSHFQPALYLLGRIQLALGKIGRALEVFTRLLALSDAPLFLAALGYSYALADKKRPARNVLKELELQSTHRYVSAYSKATIHLALGEKNEAFSCLEEACTNRCEMLTWLKVDPAFDIVRTDLRFTNLLRRVGLDREYESLQRRAAS